VIQSVVGTAAVMVIGLVGGIVAARALGVTGRGELAAAILWPGLLCTVAEFGLPTACTYLSASSPHSRRDLARGVIPMLALQSVLIWTAGVPTILLALGGYEQSVRTTAIGFLIVYAPLYLAVRYLSALNQGEGRMAVFNAARLLIPSVYGTALVLLLLLDLVSVRAFATAYAASWALALGTLLAMSSGEIRSGVLRPTLDWETARRAWSVGHRAYLGTLAPVDTLQLDVLLTTAFLGASEAGLYFVATSAAVVVRVWGTTFGALALPLVAAAEDDREAVGVMSLFTRLTGLFSGFFAVVLFVFAGPLLTVVYGSEFAPAQTLVRILAIGMLAASLRYVLGDGLRGLGHGSYATRAEGLGWIVGGIALLLLLLLWGATGVATAVSISYIVTLLLMLRFARVLGANVVAMLVPSRHDLSRGKAALRTPSAARGTAATQDDGERPGRAGDCE
jgi:O-antigen/teichoic acid export membrane protein